MKKQMTVLALCVMLVAFCSSAEAQQAKKVPRIGYISGTGNTTDQGPYVEALRQGLRDLVTSKGRTSRLNIAVPRANWT